MTELLKITITSIDQKDVEIGQTIQSVIKTKTNVSTEVNKGASIFYSYYKKIEAPFIHFSETLVGS